MKQQTNPKTTAVVPANAAKVIKPNNDTTGKINHNNDTTRKGFVYTMHDIAYELYRRSFARNAKKEVSVTFTTMAQKNHLEVKIQLIREKGELSIESTVNHFVSVETVFFRGDMKDVLSKECFFHLVGPTMKKAIVKINTALAFCGVVA